MKRSSLALVSYASSDEEDTSGSVDPPMRVESQPLPKKRKLPPVSATIVGPDHVDDPSLHQGRIRSTPHVEGQFAAHVYVSLNLGRHSPMSRLYKVVQAVLRDAKQEVPALRDIWTTKSSRGVNASTEKEAKDEPKRELHISLSRPIFLRAHQREDLKRAVKKVAKSSKPFVASFTTLSELINDEKTRTFLTMEIGAGHHELRALADALTPALEAIKQRTYYAKPRFHASIAWALLNQPETKAIAAHSVSPGSSPGLDTLGHPTPSSTLALTDESGGSESTQFPAIPCIPLRLIAALNEQYGPELSSSKVGAFDVESIVLKIGKDVTEWRLGCK